MAKKSSGVALITGASGGMGGAVAMRLASDGFDVAVHYAAGSAKADKVVSQIAAKDGRAIAIGADVTDPASVQALFAETKDKLGKIDAVVHSAGIIRRYRSSPSSRRWGVWASPRISPALCHSFWGPMGDG